MKTSKESNGVKKGKTSWKPASVLDVTGKEEGYRYRWANKASDNIYKKEQEGWETVSGLQSDSAKHESDRIQDGKQLTSTFEKHDAILMRIPEEVAQGRDDYINNKTAQRTKGLTAHFKEEAKKNGSVAHGEIKISSRKGEQIID